MPGSSRLSALALGLLVAVATLPAAVPAGSSDAPEVEDACGDASGGAVDGLPRASSDVDALWYGWEPIRGQIQQQLALCTHDTQAQKERVAKRLGWIVNWTDHRGLEWTQRVWSSGLEPTGINYRLCQGETPIGSSSKAQVDDGVAKLVISNTLPETRFEEAIYGTTVGAGRFPPPSPDDGSPWSTCGVGFAEIHDRAPDSGSGEVFSLAPDDEEASRGHGVEMRALEPEPATRAGERVRIDLRFNNTVSEIRNVTLRLDADLPGGWPVDLEPGDVTMIPDGSATATIRVEPPLTAPSGTHRLRVDGVVRNATLGRIGTVNATVTLQVVGHTFGPEMPSRSAGPTASPGAVVDHPIELTNAGTARDTFRLAVGGDLPGWVDLPTDTVTLAPGGSRELTLEIAVPADAEPGWYEHVVTATSAADPSASAELPVVTAVALSDDGAVAGSGATLPAPSAWAVLVAAGLAAILLGGRPD